MAVDEVLIFCNITFGPRSSDPDAQFSKHYALFSTRSVLTRSVLRSGKLRKIEEKSGKLKKKRAQIRKIEENCPAGPQKFTN